MIDILIQQLPKQAIIPVKMMRYCKIPLGLYNSSDPFHMIQDLDAEDICFSSMRGIVRFNLHKTEDNTVRVLVSKLSLYDIENNFVVKSYDNIIQGRIDSLSLDLSLLGKVFLNQKNKSNVCQAKFKVNHSHNNFYELYMLIVDKVKRELIYGFTLFEKG